MAANESNAIFVSVFAAMSSSSVSAAIVARASAMVRVVVERLKSSTALGDFSKSQHRAISNSKRAAALSRLCHPIISIPRRR